MKKKKFKEELINLLWKHQLNVANFLKLVNSDDFWIDKNPSKKLQKAIDESIEV